MLFRSRLVTTLPRRRASRTSSSRSPVARITIALDRSIGPILGAASDGTSARALADGVEAGLLGRVRDREAALSAAVRKQLDPVGDRLEVAAAPNAPLLGEHQMHNTPHRPALDATRWSGNHSRHVRSITPCGSA